MSQFEYLGVAFGLLYTVTALRLILVVPYALRPGARDWLHTGYVGALLVGVAVNFWKFGALRNIDWSLPRFLLALMLPATLYVVAVALVPDDAGNVQSWRDHFISMRRPFFLGLAFAGLVMAAHSTLLLGQSPQPTHFALLLLGGVGAASKDTRILGLLLAVMVGFLLTDVLLPGENPWV